MSDVTEALKIWDAFKPMIDKEIEAKTRSCIRARKMLVTSAPNGSTIGVSEPFDTHTYNIPYLAALSTAQVDDAVWVQWYFDNASTMIAMSFGDGDIPFATPSDIPAEDVFKAGDSFSVTSIRCPATVYGNKAGVGMAIMLPKRIPSDLAVQVSNATLNELRSANGAVNTPSGTITWSASANGDYGMNISMSGTTASSNAVAYSGVIAILTATFTFVAST